MRAIGLVLVLLLGGLGLVVGSAGPAAACSCATFDLRGSIDAADVVVTGTLVDIQRPPPEEIRSSIDPVTYLVDVESIYKGEAGSELEFTSALMGASCGVEGLEEGRRYTFFLHRIRSGASRIVQGEPGDLTSSLCSGNRGSRDALDRRITALTGPPVATTQVVSVPGTLASEGVPYDGSDRDWWLPATGAVLTGLAGIGVLVWRRRTASRP